MLHREPASCLLAEEVYLLVIMSSSNRLLFHESKYRGDAPFLQTSEDLLPIKLIVQLLKTHSFYFPLAWNANAISVLRQLSVDEHKRTKGTICLLVTAGKHSGMASRKGCCNIFWSKEIPPSKLPILGQRGTLNTLNIIHLTSPFTDPSLPRKK